MLVRPLCLNGLNTKRNCPNCTCPVWGVMWSIWIRPFCHWQMLSTSISMWCKLIFLIRPLCFSALHGQGSQKLYNWQNILSPPHYRNGVHHPVEIIWLYSGGRRDVSEYYIVAYSLSEPIWFHWHLGPIVEKWVKCGPFGMSPNHRCTFPLAVWEKL